MPRSCLKVVEQVEQFRVHCRGVVGAVVAKQSIELLQGVTLIVFADAIGDAKAFVGVQVAKGEYAWFVFASMPGESGRCCSSEGEAEKISPIHIIPNIVVLETGGV